MEILYGLGVVGGVVVAADIGLASAGDLATIQCGTDDAYLGCRVLMAELLEVVERQGQRLIFAGSVWNIAEVSFITPR